MTRVIAVGSTNPAKVQAARNVMARAFPNSGVSACAAPSGVSAQPLGTAETAAGARARAHGALAAVPDAWLGIGLEGGVDLAAGDLINCCCITSSARTVLTWGPRLPLPPRVIAEISAGAELGPIIDSMMGSTESKQVLGAVGLLTDGLLTRAELWESALAVALAPFLHPELYPESGRPHH